MSDKLLTRNAKSLLAKKYVSLKKSVLKDFGTYDKLIKEIRQMENDYRLGEITLNAPKELSEIFSEADKEKIYKEAWSKSISFNWEYPYHKPLMIKKFITGLCYEPTPEVMGEVFCQAIMEEPRNPAPYLYTNYELGKTKYLPLTKKVADILSYYVRATWNGEETSGFHIKRLVEESDQLFLYRQIEYHSLMHIGDELPKPEI